MNVNVIFSDKREGLVDDALLDDMLEKNMISMFQRSDGWAMAGLDSTRGSGGIFIYAGPDRRTMSENKLIEDAYIQYAA